jgi:glucose-1-phosphate adenylyltransferase
MVVLAGDHVYKMDYEVMLQQHEASGADVTVGCIEVPRMEATGFGVMHVDAEDRITAFLEKPKDPPGMPDKPDTALASMGIYVFNTDFLARELRRDAADANSSHDFGSDLVPHIVRHGTAVAHRFTSSCVTSGVEEESYWRDVGTVDAYWQANIDLTDVVPALNLYDRDWPIWTYSELTPPAKFVFDDEGRRGTAVDSLVAGGTIVSGSRVTRSVLSTNVRVHSFCAVKGAVLLPGVHVGRHVRLTDVVVDSGVHLPEGLVVGEDAEADARRFRRSARGVTLITQSMIDALDA